jgi:hypothetical protein
MNVDESIGYTSQPAGFRGERAGRSKRRPYHIALSDDFVKVHHGGDVENDCGQQLSGASAK